MKIHETVDLPTNVSATQFITKTLCGRNTANLRIDGMGVVYDEDYHGKPTCKQCLAVMKAWDEKGDSDE